MQITESLKDHLNQELSQRLEEKIEIFDFAKLHGGSVNYSFLLRTNKKAFFMKLNDALAFPNMFALEVDGLDAIKKTKTLNVPDSILEGKFNEMSYLVLDFIESRQTGSAFWENFGKELANLHQNTQKEFGLGYSNYVGSLKQGNSVTDSWSEFFGNNRIMTQAKMAYDNGRIDFSLMRDLEHLSQKSSQYFPTSEASLLHGDLWSGNFMVGKEGLPVVIDPAIYYGNREMDIAMSMLFGGFNKRFYDVYNEVNPLDKNWEERIDLCNAYPLLVHVNLFGASYAQRLKSAIKRYL